MEEYARYIRAHAGKQAKVNEYREKQHRENIAPTRKHTLRCRSGEPISSRS